MKKPFLSFFKTLAFSAVAVSMIFISSCGSDDDDDDGGPVEATQTILEIAQATDGLDSLVKYLSVEGNEDLVAALGAPGTNTVFAPTNEAFIGLLQTPGFPADIADINPAIVRGVLAYHVVPGQEVLEADFAPSLSLPTLYSDPTTGANQVITFNEDGTILTGSTTQNITTAATDVAATNGVVHLTNSVLIPPSVGATLTPILGTNGGTVLLGADFTSLAGALTLAETYAAATEGVDPLTPVLIGATKNTVFAPVDAVFADPAVVALTEDFEGGDWYSVISHHVVVGDATDEAVDPSTLSSDASAFTSALGLPLSISTGEATIPGGPGIFIDSDGDGIPNAEVALSVTTGNGTVHAIVGVLTPPAPEEGIIVEK